MILTLLFYLAFAIGEMVLVVWSINVVHGMGWKVRWHEELTVLTLVGLGLGSFELTRRWWLVPVGEWPIALQLAAAACCLMTFVVLPLVTLGRRRRPPIEGLRRTDHRHDLVGQEPRERFLGEGWGRSILRIPGNESLKLVVHDWTLPIRDLPQELEGLSILHLTDLHFSLAYNRRYFEAVFDIAADCPADLVFVTGDLIDDPACIDWITPILGRVTALLGRYAILGNHDHEHDLDKIFSAVSAAGYTVLDGNVVTLDILGRRVSIGGTCAPWGPAITDESIPPASFHLLLSHTPDLAYHASRQGWNFMLCGHNHGGQVQLPLIGPVLMPSRYSRRFDRGFYQIDRTLMYVSQGIGAKHPLRFGCPPEISRFTLTRGDDLGRREHSGIVSREGQRVGTER